MSEPAERDLRIGIDVGGTNTDAAVLDHDHHIVAWTKQPTSADVTSGIRAALTAVLDQLGDDRSRVGRVMLGTTHATNAILERRSLGRVGVIRIGAPATRAVPPLCGWPADLVQTAAAGRTIVAGGHLIDGYPIAPLDVEAVKRFLDSLAGAVDAVAVTGVFSPAFADQEREVAELATAILGPERPVSMSHEIGTLGLIERENATVLNAALYGVATDVIGALDGALREHGFDLAPFFAQNDGTLMALEYAARYPVLTIGSGPANSIRGAAFLSGNDDAIVVDVGGTSTDLGVLVNGFPRESSAAVDLGGVRTNFRMPDILSVAIGGGTVVGGTPNNPVLGPESVGFRIAEQALCFGGSVPTLTDAAVSVGRFALGKPPQGEAVNSGLLVAALHAVEQLVSDAVDQVSLGKLAMPVVVVGGGSVLLPDSLDLVAETIRPDHSGIANAVGAAIALVSGRWDAIVPTGAGHDEAIARACDTAIRRAIEAGAQPGKVDIVELNEVPLSYLPKPSIRVSVKAAGPLGRL